MGETVQQENPALLSLTPSDKAFIINSHCNIHNYRGYLTVPFDKLTLSIITTELKKLFCLVLP